MSQERLKLHLEETAAAILYEILYFLVALNAFSIRC